jgi:hypothetical protein
MKNSKPIIITGEQYIERLADSQSRDDIESCNASLEYAFGYKNLTITVNGITKPLSKDDDKFIIYAEDIATARSEFWSRWAQYVNKAFNRKFVPILNNK